MAPMPISTPTPAHPPPTAAATTTKTATDPSLPPPKKRKTAPHSTLHTHTIRQQTWTYFHLRLTTTSPSISSSIAPSETSPSLDPLTIRSLLTPPLQSYLGLTGAAIPIDILTSAGRDVWIRVNKRDAKGVQASFSGWVGSVEGALVPGEEEGGEKRVRVSWRVVEKMGVLGRGNGGDLFGE